MVGVESARQSGDEVEAVVGIMLRTRYPNAHRLQPSQGDGGVDVFVPQLPVGPTMGKMTSPTPPRQWPALTRRAMLLGTAVLGVLAGGSLRDSIAAGAPGTSTETFEVSHTDQEWRQLLTPQQYAVLRQAGTETPFSSPLDDEHRPGIFRCAGCALDLFSSTTKFDSGTGWPSFWKALDNAVLERQDNTLGMTRTEVLCRRCGGHLGHVFNDGPAPTGLRYCMNGVALSFRPT